MSFKKIISLLTLLIVLALPLTSVSALDFSSAPDLELGSTSPFVTSLQKVLNSNGFVINPVAGQPGSIGYESDYFGKLTQTALSKFQSAFGLSPSAGYFGAKTKMKVSEVAQGDIKEVATAPSAQLSNLGTSNSTLTTWWRDPNIYVGDYPNANNTGPRVPDSQLTTKSIGTVDEAYIQANGGRGSDGRFVIEKVKTGGINISAPNVTIRDVITTGRMSINAGGLIVEWSKVTGGDNGPALNARYDRSSADNPAFDAPVFRYNELSHSFDIIRAQPYGMVAYRNYIHHWASTKTANHSDGIQFIPETQTPDSDRRVILDNNHWYTKQDGAWLQGAMTINSVRPGFTVINNKFFGAKNHFSENGGKADIIVNGNVAESMSLFCKGYGGGEKTPDMKKIVVKEFNQNVNRATGKPYLKLGDHPSITNSNVWGGKYCDVYTGSPNTYTFLDVDSSTVNGSITASPNQTSYLQGSTVTIAPYPNPGYKFSHWEGACTGSNPTCTINMSSNKTIKPIYVSDGSPTTPVTPTTPTTPVTPTTFTLTSTTAGTGSGTISGNTTTYTSGATATLIATPATGSTFTSWSGCTSTSGTTCTVSMTANKTVSANFTLNPVIVTPTNPNTFTVGARVLVTGSINVRSSSAITSTNKIGTQSQGALGTITEGPKYSNDTLGKQVTWWNINYDSGVDGWSGQDNLAVSTTPVPVTPTTPTTPVTPTTFTLTSTTAGTGSGTISGNTTTYTSGATATLTATPAAGSTFTSWSGCTSTSGTTCTVSMTANKTVTATFTAATFSIGSRVVVIEESVNIRSLPNIDAKYRIGRQIKGQKGTIVEGPTYSPNTKGVQITWWNINYDSGVDGWNGEENLKIESGSVPAAPIPSTPSSNTQTYSMSLDLELGTTNPGVLTLQKYLNSNGFIINPIAGQPGSIGYESDYFGEKTKQALIKFQQAKGITPAAGYFGAKTRGVMGI